MNPHNINKLVSLTFDEDPSVRVKAAQSLGESDDPAAIFALMELSYDKDPQVKEAAQDLLEKKKKAESEVMSFAEIFNRRAKKSSEKQDKIPADKKEKLLSPITKLFEKKLGKEKAEQIKSKMMPAIEKVYLKSVGSYKTTNNENGRKAMQEFLTSYLEAMSDIESIDGADIREVAEKAQITVEKPVVVPEDETELEVVGNKAGEIDENAVLQVEDLSDEIAQIKAEEAAVIAADAEITNLPDTLLKRAYEVAMLSEGDDSVMKTEMNRMVKKTTRDIKDAFGYAKKKFKSVKITHLAKIKEGMRNINTDLLDVISVESKEYIIKKRTGETSVQTRILVRDEDGTEAVIYLFDGRGTSIPEGCNIKVSKGYVKTISNETAITVGKRGNVYIVL